LTHGVHDYERERSALLLLAPGAGHDGSLSADAIERLAAPPVVLLGACGTAAGPRRAGDDGASHLGGAFLVAGASAVVTAPGDLPQGATVDLVAEFLAAWERGVPLPEALRRARAAVAAVPRRAHPYYFAGLRHVGIDPDAGR
jgi:CHAT domain-containing protein